MWVKFKHVNIIYEQERNTSGQKQYDIVCKEKLNLLRVRCILSKVVSPETTTHVQK